MPSTVDPPTAAPAAGGRLITAEGSAPSEAVGGSRLAAGVCIGAGIVAGAVLGRSSLLHWGANDEERGQTLTGDSLIPAPHLEATRAITILRPPTAVWPWIAQLGQGRGGFYSYDALENLVGCDIHSADRVVPAWQDIRIGDEVLLAPGVALDVAIADAPHALVLRGGPPMGGPPLYDFTWAFLIRDGAEGTTRLVVRERYRFLRAWTWALVEPVELVSFVMSRKMLKGIRDRSEAIGVATPRDFGDPDTAGRVEASHAGGRSHA